MEENNNLYEEKKNSNKVLIGIIIVLSVALLGLSYYTFFVRDKVDNTENPIVEDNKKEEEKEQTDYSRDTYNGIYSTNLSNTEDIDKLVVDFPYARIITDNANHNQIWKTYTLFNIISKIDGTTAGACAEDYELKKDATKDSNGVTYPVYTDESEKVAKEAGLTVDEISKIDKNLWQIGGGQYCFTLYDAGEIKTKYNGIYDNMFEKSFFINLGSLGILNFGTMSTGMTYDKNVNKIQKTSGGGTAPNEGRKVTIINTTNNEGLYKVEFVEGFFSGLVDAPSTLELTNEKAEINLTYQSSDLEFEKVLKEYQDKLPHYEVTFKIVDGAYQFDNIVKK